MPKDPGREGAMVRDPEAEGGPPAPGSDRGAPSDFVEAGSLRPPGPIGRVARFLLGLGCLWVIAGLVLQGGGLISGALLGVFPGWWIVIALALWVFPEVVNIGWGTHLSSRRLRAAVAIAGVGAAVAGRLTIGSAASWPLGGLLYVWLWYTFGHLSISLVLAAIIGTPGCEMRAIPQLWGRLTGRSATEHFCPGPFTPLDEWEAGTERRD